MEQPFYFGTVVSNRVFLNRTAELKHLHNNFENGVNTILISPRRWGKTSLVKKASETYRVEEVKFVFLDAFRMSSKKQFLEQLADAVLQATYSKAEEFLKQAGTFFTKLMPEISLSTNPNTSFSFKIGWKGQELPESEILDLPEKVATLKNIKIILCIDEFQNIDAFDKKQTFQKELRSFWQHHHSVMYCLYGSKPSVMHDFFNKQNMPFYRFGEVLYLDKISKQHWVDYIVKRFRLFGKSISEEAAEMIASKMDLHSYYVQQLAYITFIHCPLSANLSDVATALKLMLHQNQILYRRIFNDLSSPQIEFLRALSEGATQFYTKSTMGNYDMGTVGNIKRVKEALENKEVIDTFGEFPAFTDPGFALWFKHFYLQVPYE